MKRFILLTVCSLCVAWELASCECVTVRSPKVPQNFTVFLAYSGHPLGDIHVSIFDIASAKIAQTVVTNTQGRAEVRELHLGTYRVTTAVSEDHYIEVTAKAANNELRIDAVFDRPAIEVAAANGVIADGSGAPIVGAIAVLEMPQSHAPVAVATANMVGSISLHAPDGAYVLRVARQGFVTAAIPLKVARTGWSGFRVTLPVGGCPATGTATIKPAD